MRVLPVLRLLMPGFTLRSELRQELLLLHGVNTRVVMDILGPSQISITSRYQHVLPEAAKDAADRMGRALWG